MFWYTVLLPPILLIHSSCLVFPNDLCSQNNLKTKEAIMDSKVCLKTDLLVKVNDRQLRFHCTLILAVLGKLVQSSFSTDLRSKFPHIHLVVVMS